MKGSRSTTNKQSKQGMSHKPRPEIRDDLDSRKVKRNQERVNKSQEPVNKSQDSRAKNQDK